MKLAFGKSKSPAVTQAPKASAGGVTRHLRLRDLIVLVGAALVLYASAGGLFVWQQNQNQEQSFKQTEAAALDMAERLAGRLRAYRTELEKIAADAPLIALFAGGDSEGLQQREAEIAQQLKDALHVALLPADWDLGDSSELEYMGFASLEIVRTAKRTGKPSLFELHRFGSPQQHIAVAVPVLSSADQSVVGVIHAAFPTNLVQPTLDGAAAFPGKLMVRQVAGDKPLLLAEVGRAQGAAGKEDGKQLVGGTLWELAYWHGEAVTGATEYALFFGTPTLVLVLLGAGLLLRSPRTATNQDWSPTSADKAMAAHNEVAPAQPAASQPAKESAKGLLARLWRSKGAKPTSQTPAAADEQEQAPSVPLLSPSTADLIVEDEEVPLLLDLEPETAAAVAPAPFPDEIFRAYDIRGIVGETLTRHGVYELGRAIGSAAYDKGQQTVIIARDGRLSGEELISALASGLQDSGRDVVDLGVVPTPVLYFATHFLGSNSGVMLTGSHNAPQYNGLKVVLNGEALAGKAIRALGQRVADGDLLQGEGSRQEQNLAPDYIKRICGDVKLARPLKVAVDCGNGVAGVLAPALLRALGCEVIELFCEVDGHFPNHHPDPGQPENLAALIQAVQSQGADLGVAFDGDGDRLGVVDSAGNIIWPDRVLMLLAADVLSRHPGADILYDVKSTRNLAAEILAQGGSPQMCATGHSLIKAKMKETGALLAGEMSGHIFFKERWYGFDDALYGCARLLEILSMDARSSAEVFAVLPDSVNTPELHMAVAEGDKFGLMQRIIEQARFPEDARRTTIDGLRVEIEEGWGLVRASNTSPALIFRFEADDAPGLEKIQGLFREQLLEIDPQLKLPF